jgi:hypothetical protein
VNPLPIQLLLTLGAAAAFHRLFAACRTSRIGWRRAAFWALLWTVGLTVVWNPDLTTRFARIIGVTRGVDVVLYCSVLLLSYLVFRLYAALEVLDQVVTRLVSELALRDARAEPWGSSQRFSSPEAATPLRNQE